MIRKSNKRLYCPLNNHYRNSFLVDDNKDRAIIQALDDLKELLAHPVNLYSSFDDRVIFNIRLLYKGYMSVEDISYRYTNDEDKIPLHFVNSHEIDKNLNYEHIYNLINFVKMITVTIQNAIEKNKSILYQVSKTFNKYTTEDNIISIDIDFGLEVGIINAMSEDRKTVFTVRFLTTPEKDSVIDVGSFLYDIYHREVKELNQMSINESFMDYNPSYINMYCDADISLGSEIYNNMSNDIEIQLTGWGIFDNNWLECLEYLYKKNSFNFKLNNN